ncbi:protein phosphatase 2C domain-containing protein [Calothrix sp. 336/3]|uniref:protein phosphatase 2C domain-containing protein n=1 Tax=Calothrix sp. 336/3 TaxID=1337936 RepID=UPI0006993BFF|nr:protein phosphatase 2C domain-containing protein [Calothrix sp. 336/3]
MENDAAILDCPNELCQAPNNLTDKYCKQCGTFLPKRFLWVAGEVKYLGKPGEIIGDRYLIIKDSILFDTKPGTVPNAPEPSNIQAIRPYLRLIPYRLNAPQVYGILPISQGNSTQEILLLEKPPLVVNSNSQLEVSLCPSLDKAWSQATSLRQLNWLWQIAQLWQPLATEGVASTLLNWQLLRTEGSLVKLLELQADRQPGLTLKDLGAFWLQLQANSQPAIAEFLLQVCNLLQEGKIHAAEQLVSVLDQGLAELGRGKGENGKSPTSTAIAIATKSDTGPSRQRNEDACYPPSGSHVTKPPENSALAIVCDGIGGHEGGNVASNLAIETIQQQIQQLTQVPSDHINPTTFLEDLQRAAASANDKISQRNDSESRQGRQRMGTTLVMALPVAHEMYIAHVGDSRAYWITRQGCYQVTLDDDVASREVRLGYAIYRDAVLQGSSGSLVQALGMGSSNSLHPTAERYILDEDSIFLLCSDGLSDFDRVEQHWETEILPILAGDTDVVTATDKLVEIANTQNGHDNVTIALMYYQIRFQEPETPIKVGSVEPLVIPEVKYEVNTALPQQAPAVTTQRTQVVPDTITKRRSPVPLQLVVLAFLFVAGATIGIIWRIYNQQNSNNNNPPPTPTLPGVSSDPTSTISASPLATNNGSALPTRIPLKPGVIITTTDLGIGFQRVQSLESLPQKSLPEIPIPTGSKLQVINPPAKDARPEEEDMVQLKVCSIPPSSPTSLLRKGDIGWVSFAQIKKKIAVESSPPGGQTPEKPDPCLGNG